MVAAPGISDASEDAGEHVDKCDQHEQFSREKGEQINDESDQDEEPEGLAASEINLFAAPEAPGADHEEADEADQQDPDRGDPPGGNRPSDKRVNDGGNDARCSRNGHADEIFAIGTARIFGNRVDADVEAGETGRSAEQEEEADEDA